MIEKTEDFIGPEVHKRARETWGLRAQLIALGEELCEAGAAVMRALNGKGDVDKVLEELVDVESLRLNVKDDLGSAEEWARVQQAKRAKLKAKLDQGVRRV